MDDKGLVCVGLGGDGDEVEAIARLERVFGVTLDESDARNWRTAGDVYAALCKVKPGASWTLFTRTLTETTRVSPSMIQMHSPLLARPVASRAFKLFQLLMCALVAITAIASLAKYVLP